MQGPSEQQDISTQTRTATTVSAGTYDAATEHRAGAEQTVFPSGPGVGNTPMCRADAERRSDAWMREGIYKM